jgi:hypothetical protein
MAMYSENHSNTIRLLLTVWLVCTLETAVCKQSSAADDTLQRAINYIFTGRVDPKDAPEIVDRAACIIVLPQPASSRYARYYLKRFNMDAARISTKYAGSRTLHELEVGGDDVIVEYLKLDKTTVDYGLRSAHISLSGSSDVTDKAIKIVFDEYCKPKKSESPF